MRIIELFEDKKPKPKKDPKKDSSKDSQTTSMLKTKFKHLRPLKIRKKPKIKNPVGGRAHKMPPIKKPETK